MGWLKHSTTVGQGVHKSCTTVTPQSWHLLVMLLRADMDVAEGSLLGLICCFPGEGLTKVWPISANSTITRAASPAHPPSTSPALTAATQACTHTHTWQWL